MRSKVCDYCGRSFQWRKKWEKDWEQVKFCSSSCRHHGKDKENPSLESSLMELLKQRSGSICPSEILSPDEKKDRLKMEKVRCAARRLVHRGCLEILQKNKVVSPDNFRGPVRLRLKKEYL